MAMIGNDQRKAILDILDLGDDRNMDYLFKTADVMPTTDISRQERDQVRAFLRECDKAMIRLALAYHSSKEAQNEETANQLLLHISGMWNDLNFILATPTLETVHKTETHSLLDKVKKYLDQLAFTKPHLHHGVDPSQPQPKPKRAKTEISVPTSNRFEVLDESRPSTSTAPEENEAEMSESIQTGATQPKPPHVDPIFILITGDWPAYVRHLNQNILSTPVKAKLSGEYMKITPASPEDYRKLSKHLIDTKMSFHALMPKAERPKKILIRGLPTCINPDAIGADLISLGFTPIHVSMLRKRGLAKDPLPLFLVTLKSNPGWEKIYEVDHLLETSVSIKSFRSSGTKQCYRCQGFGHSSHNCYMPARCLKCGQGHESRDCQKPRSEKPTCANCGGPHTSNYSGCSAHPKNQVIKGKQKPSQLSYQAYLNYIKSGSTTFKPIDAPPPKIPAWNKRNPKIYLPPGKTYEEFPHLPDDATSDAESETDVPPRNLHAQRRRAAAERRSAAQKLADDATRRTREQHATITNQTQSNGCASLSSFSEAVKSIQEFNSIVNLPLLITKLKELVTAIKDAPTDLDRAYIIMEKLQGLSEAFYKSK